MRSAAISGRWRATGPIAIHHILWFGPAEHSPVPAARSRCRRAQRRSRPARFRAAEGLVLTAASTTARLARHGHGRSPLRSMTLDRRERQPIRIRAPAYRGWSLAYSRHVQRGRPRGDDRCLRTDRNSDLCPLRTMIYHYGGDQTALVRNLENLLPICSLHFG
jgi:hypothetical protein